MKILLAGPGTGKTTNIGNIISEHGDGSKFLILSFTNATVKDLQNSLKKKGVTDSNCMTLHKFAVKYNHDYSRHVLGIKEKYILKKISESKFTQIPFDSLCDFLNCTTFEQMIERFVEFAELNPLYLQEKLSNYDTLIVDEYQDFNPAEQKLIDILIEEINASYVLGDDDQCIYDFKDASSDKIISFDEDLNNEKIPHEHKCYRCPDKVVEHATNLIRNNKKRVDKKWDKSGREEGVIKHCQLKNLEEVANDIATIISSLGEEEILVLTPVRFAAEPVINKLKECNIEFTNYFIEKIPDELIDRSLEVRFLFGNFKYLNLVLLGYTHLTNRKKFYTLLKKHFDQGADFDELFMLLKNKLPELISNNKLNLDDFLSQDYYLNISSLYEIAQGDTPEEKLENIFRTTEDQKEKKIKIMTIRQAKGLGADHVFIVGLNEGIIPNKELGNDSIESQRRLFYVGITRTKKQLFLYSNMQIDVGQLYANKANIPDFRRIHPKSRIFQGKSSSFISELKLE